MATPTAESLRERILVQVPGASVELVPNGAPGATPSLLVDAAHGRAVAEFLRDDPSLQLDFCSNVTGVDWPAYLEAVYHLYSVALRHGPVILRLRTANRTDQVSLPSLTPVWRSCEFQEREAYDLFGIRFEGHPDLRRLLMWDGFKDHPMRKDYVPPDDFEWEPTPHDEVLARAKTHLPAAPEGGAP